MAILVSCPTCGAAAKVMTSLWGKNFQCRSCNTPFQINPGVTNGFAPSNKEPPIDYVNCPGCAELVPAVRQKCLLCDTILEGRSETCGLVGSPRPDQDYVPSHKSSARSGFRGARARWSPEKKLAIVIAAPVGIVLLTVLMWAGLRTRANATRSAKNAQLAAGAALMKSEEMIWTLEGDALKQAVAIVQTAKRKGASPQKGKRAKSPEAEKSLRENLRAHWSESTLSRASEFIRTMDEESRLYLQEAANRVGSDPPGIVLEWLTFEGAYDFAIINRIWKEQAQLRGGRRELVDSFFKQTNEAPTLDAGVSVLTRRDDRIVVSLFGATIVEELCSDRIEAPNETATVVWWKSNYNQLRAMIEGEKIEEEMQELMHRDDAGEYHVAYAKLLEEYFVGPSREPWLQRLRDEGPLALGPDRSNVDETPTAGGADKSPAAPQLPQNPPKESRGTAADRPKGAGNSPFEIVSIDARPTDSNEYFTTYAWKLTLRSQSESSLVLSAHIQYLDADKFQLAEDFALRLVLKPHEEQSFTGSSMISAKVANRIASYNATVRAQ